MPPPTSSSTTWGQHSPAPGHDANVETLFLVEGLLIYLPEEVIVSLLTALRARATPASRMAVSISRGQSAEIRARVAAVGEHMQSAFTEGEASALLQRCGWNGTPRARLYLHRPAEGNDDGSARRETPYLQLQRIFPSI